MAQTRPCLVAVTLALALACNGVAAQCLPGGMGMHGLRCGGRSRAALPPFFSSPLGAGRRGVVQSFSPEILRLLMENVTLPFEPLGYDYDALEPNIDEATMTLHHDKHYAGYVKKCNAAINDANSNTGTVAEGPFMTTLLLTPSFLEDLSFNCGGALNHAALWRLLSPNAQAAPSEGSALQKAIDRDFGSTEEMLEELTAEAAGVQGSGWAWLVLDYATGALSITTTANQDRPPSPRYVPLAGIDVWEHAYYLKHQNRRADYLESLWEVMDFAEIENLFNQATGEEVDEAEPPTSANGAAEPPVSQLA